MVLQVRTGVTSEEGVKMWRKYQGTGGLDVLYFVLGSGYVYTNSSGCTFKTCALH